VTRSALDRHRAKQIINGREDGDPPARVSGEVMDYLHNLNLEPEAEADGVVEVRQNLWLISSDEVPPLLFTPEEAARCLSVGRPKVYRLMQEGVLRSVKVGASRRVSARALSDYVAALEMGGVVW
jgi:excisionase family DNA binding protein